MTTPVISAHRDLRFRRRLSGALLTAISLGATAGCHRPAQEAADDKKNAPIPVQAVAVAEATQLRRIVTPATVHAYYEAQLHAQVRGYIDAVEADIGDVVQAGDVLARIAIPELRQGRNVAAAGVTAAQASQTQAAAGIALAQANLVAARAAVETAESEVVAAQASDAAADSEFRRTGDLVDRGSVTNRLLDEARSRREAAGAGLSAARSAKSEVQSQVNVAQAQLQTAEAAAVAADAQLAVAQARLAEAEAQVAFADIKAPFAGLVTARHANPGDLVSASDAQPLFVVSQTQRLRLQMPVPESDAAMVAVGDTISLRFPSYASEPAITAKIDRIAGRLDNASRTMLVEATLDNAEGKLLPGMFGEATITPATLATEATLPARAVRFSETGKAYVYAIIDGHVSVRDVEVVSDDGTHLAISGVTTGTTVVDSHLRRFRDGEAVRVLNP